MEAQAECWKDIHRILEAGASLDPRCPERSSQTQNIRPVSYSKYIGRYSWGRIPE
jgi:hypothetical protein